VNNETNKLKKDSEISIIDLFNEDEITETSSGAYKTICPTCGLQGGRTEGFMLFADNNMAYCHTTGKNFNLLETAALKFGIINCVEGRDTGEKGTVLKGESFKQTLDLIEENFGEEYYFKLAENLKLNISEKFVITEYKKDGEVKSKIVDIDKVAKHIINKFNIKTIFGLKEETIYVYNEGIWTRQGRGLIKAEIENLLRVYAKNNVVNEVLEKIKRKTEEDREDFNITPNYMMCYNNGVLDFNDLDNIVFLPHDKKYNFKTKMNVNFNPEADCPQIKKFIAETFYEVDQPQVQEWIGFHNIPKYAFKKAAILTGARDTGKTVFLNLLTKYLGKQNTSNLSLQEISRAKSFDLLSLENKFANIHDDLSSRDMNDSGGFKMAVGDGEISGEEKFGDRRRFRNTAKMTFSCNQIPSVKELNDDAYYSRWLIWILEKSVPKEAQDINLIDKLTSQQELSGLLNWSIDGLRRLFKNNCFTNEQDSAYNKELMLQNTNSIAKFVNQKLIYSVGASVTKDEMYIAYCDFCTKQEPQLTPVSKTKLGNDLNKFASYINPDLRTNKERSWGNVLITNSDNYTTLKNNMCNYQKSVNNDITNNIYNFSEAGIPVTNSTNKNMPKTAQNITKPSKKRNLRDVQFWDDPECKNIKPACTEEEVLNFLIHNSGVKIEDFYKALGNGSLKFLTNNPKIKNENGVLELIV